MAPLFTIIKPVSSIRFRPIDFEADRDFLREVYGKCRLDSDAIASMTPGERDFFINMQYKAQCDHYIKEFPNAHYSVMIDENNEQVGRLFLDKREKEYRILDIGLLPSFRGKGIGKQVIGDIISEAESDQPPRSVTIYVERMSPSLSLFVNLGFESVLVDSSGNSFFMTRKPGKPEA